MNCPAVSNRATRIRIRGSDIFLLVIFYTQVFTCQAAVVSRESGLIKSVARANERNESSQSRGAGGGGRNEEKKVEIQSEKRATGGATEMYYIVM